jgi:hypothetical protein
MQIRCLPSQTEPDNYINTLEDKRISRNNHWGATVGVSSNFSCLCGCDSRRKDRRSHSPMALYATSL